MGLRLRIRPCPAPQALPMESHAATRPHAIGFVGKRWV